MDNYCKTHNEHYNLNCYYCLRLENKKPKPDHFGQVDTCSDCDHSEQWENNGHCWDECAIYDIDMNEDTKCKDWKKS